MNAPDEIISSTLPAQFGTAGGAELLLSAIIFLPIVFLILAFGILLYCLIFRKTGYPWALGFLLLVPFGQLILLCILAFGNWPVLQRLRQLEEQAPSQA